MSKVAVVTGGNKGIGFYVVKGLCENYKGIVYLTSRDIGRGTQAVKKLESLGLHPKFHQLDVTDPKSIDSFRDYIKANHDGINILINNAAIAFKSRATEPVEVQAEVTLNVNYFSLLNVCNTLLPIVNKGGRVINLSSSLGHLSVIPSRELRAQFADKNLTVNGLSELAQKYIEATKSGNNERNGWGSSSYAVSKVAVSALTFIFQRDWDSKGIIFSCVDPGYVKTDMSSQGGYLEPERGAQSTVYAALADPNIVKGAFVWDNNEVIDWYSDDVPPSSTK